MPAPTPDTLTNRFRTMILSSCKSRHNLETGPRPTIPLDVAEASGDFCCRPPEGDDLEKAACQGVQPIPSIAREIYDEYRDLIIEEEATLSAARNSALLDTVLSGLRAFRLRHLLAVTKVMFDGRLFYRDHEGLDALLVPCVNTHSEIDDVAAFDLAQLGRFARLRAQAWCVGEENVFMSNALGGALVVHPDINAWLKNDGTGIVILDFRRALRELHDRSIKRLAVTSGREARELERAFRLESARLMPQVVVTRNQGGAT